ARAVPRRARTRGVPRLLRGEQRGGVLRPGRRGVRQSRQAPRARGDPRPHALRAAARRPRAARVPRRGRRLRPAARPRGARTPAPRRGRRRAALRTVGGRGDRGRADGRRSGEGGVPRARRARRAVRLHALRWRGRTGPPRAGRPPRPPGNRPGATRESRTRAGGHASRAASIGTAMRRLRFSAVLLALLGLLPAQDRLTPELLWQMKRVGDPQISPDGSKVLYTVRTVDLPANRTSAQLYLIDLASGERRQLTSVGSNSGGRWSPDGRRIAFVSTRSGSPQVWVLPIDGGEAKQVTQHANGVANVAWSPTG